MMKVVKIDDICIPVVEEQFNSANILKVTVGSTGYRGGDTGHGGRTYFALEDLGSTDMRVRVNKGEWVEMMSARGPVEIAFGGDCELSTFIEALETAVRVLKEQTDVE